MDFIQTYMPSQLELTPAEVNDTRTRLEAFVRTSFPQLDLSPGTVMGDLIITPQAFTLTAVETGVERFMSDLDLGNVAEGIIFNCDFVEKYLHNFAADPTESLQGSGVVRLVFAENQTYILDRSVRFQFGNSVYTMYLPFATAMTIYPVGSQLPTGQNGVVLRDTGSATFFADIPVVCEVGTAEVAIGTGGLINTVITELGAITALTRLSAGSATITLPQLAKRTRTTIYAASMNTRNSAVRYAYTMCPFIDGAYAIKSGDPEMLRSFYTSATNPPACLDMYVRSAGYEFTEQQTLTLVRQEVSPGVWVWEGDWDYTGTPYYIESVRHVSVPDVANIPHVVTSTPDLTTVLRGSRSYTKHERLHIQVEDSARYAYTPTMVGSEVVRTSQFTITYRTDPMLRVIADTIESSDNLPINVSTLVRGFIPVIIEKFEVEYVRKQGVLPLLDEAKDSILTYLGNIGYPDAYSDAKIADIMNSAGARYVKSVNVNARVQWSVADLLVNDGEVMPMRLTRNPLIDAVQPSLPATPEAEVIINTSADLRVNYPGPMTQQSTLFACSIRNLRYYVMDSAISFKEVKEVG